jgi:hypothetical protein
MEQVGAPSTAEISEAVVVWTGRGNKAWPVEDELGLAERFGEDRARDLMPILHRLKDEFYESDAALTVDDPVEARDLAAERFAELHPELSRSAIEAFAWSYSYYHK